MENHHFLPVPTRPQGGRRTQREMFPLVEKWLESGERQIDFCQRHGLKTSLLAYWLKKYRSQSDAEPEGFVSVSVGPARTAELEICYPNGVTIRSGAGVGARFLRELAGQC